MNSDWIYPVELRREENGVLHAYSSAAPEAIAWGATREDALREMREAITALAVSDMRQGQELAPPARGTPAETERVALRPELAAKAALYCAWRQAGITKVELAARMGRNEREVRRILDPSHRSGLDQIDEAAQALGMALVVGIRAAV